MSLRWKLLILLLILAVLPLVIAMWYTLDDLRSSGESIASELRREMKDSAEQHLSDLATSLAQEVHLDIEMIDLTLMTWAGAVVQQWESYKSGPGGEARTRGYYAEDVRNGTVSPEDLTTDPRYFTLEDDGSQTLDPITTKWPIFHIPPGGERASFDDDIRRLLGAFWTLRVATDVQVKLAHRYILALENGLYMNFPGNTDLPADFDPTIRPWYELGKISRGVSRTYPYVDAGTGQLVSSFTYPIRLTDGTLIGVVACDIVLTEFFDRLSIPPEWNHAASTMIVNPVNDRVMGDRLEIVANEEPETRFSDQPLIAAEPYHVDVKDTPGLQEVIDQMRLNAHGTGTLELPEGNLLWSYAPMTAAGPYLLLEVPEAVVAEKARQVQSWLATEIRRHAWRNIVFIGVLIIVIVALAFLCARSVTRPISNLVLVAKKVSDGDLDARADVNTSDEVGELGEVFNEMVPQLRDRMRIREALGVAMEVQQNLLPSAPPKLDGFDIAGRSVYCDETGGDYYDFLELTEIGDGILGVAVGDVTGHGIAAALLMATARGALRARLAAPGTLADVMSQVNRRLAQDTQSGRFMTLFFLILDKQLSEMRWVSAGHDPMLKFCPTSGQFQDLGGSDIPLGIDGQWSFTETSETGWNSGEIFVIGTDGIWESRNSSGEMFGKDRLREVVRLHAECSAEEIAHKITEELDQYRGTQHQEDDVTLVVIKVT